MVKRARAERADELVGKGLHRRVAHAGTAAEGAHVVSDRVQEVGLAEAGRGVEEEWVISLARELRDGQ